MGGVLHAERRVHQGVRLWRQSALPAGHGERRDRQEPQRTARTAAPGPDAIPQRQPRRDHAVAIATRRRGAGAARPEIRLGRAAGRSAGFRVLHRLQRAEDAAYRAARARHHGCARRHLPGDGRAEPLLRRQADANRRRRDVRTHGRELDREDVALEIRPGALLVPELLRPVHRDDDSGDRAPGRRAAVRDERRSCCFSASG